MPPAQQNDSEFAMFTSSSAPSSASPSAPLPHTNFAYEEADSSMMQLRVPDAGGGVHAVSASDAFGYSQMSAMHGGLLGQNGWQPYGSFGIAGYQPLAAAGRLGVGAAGSKMAAFPIGTTGLGMQHSAMMSHGYGLAAPQSAFSFGVGLDIDRRGLGRKYGYDDSAMAEGVGLEMYGMAYAQEGMYGHFERPAGKGKGDFRPRKPGAESGAKGDGRYSMGDYRSNFNRFPGKGDGRMDLGGRYGKADGKGGDSFGRKGGFDNNGGSRTGLQYHHTQVPRPLDLKKKFVQDAQKQPVTTLMIRNIPNRYTAQMLLDEIDQLKFKDACDFMYLPMDLQNDANVGYAFINFSSWYDAKRFQEVFKDYKFTQIHSHKIGQTTAAHIQGFEANVKHYLGTAVMDMKPRYRPVVIRNGVPEPLSSGLEVSLLDRPELREAGPSGEELVEPVPAAAIQATDACSSQPAPPPDCGPV